MSETPRRKWVDIQVDLFLEAAQQQSDETSRLRFEDLFRRLVAPITPDGPQRSGSLRGALPGAAAKPTDPD